VNRRRPGTTVGTKLGNTSGKSRVEVACTTTDQHERVDVGWIFRALPADNGEPVDHIELLCVPVVEGDDGVRKPWFEMLADQRQEVEQLASDGVIDSLTVAEMNLRELTPRGDDLTPTPVLQPDLQQPRSDSHEQTGISPVRRLSPGP
jgi:hypothetical protein